MAHGAERRAQSAGHRAQGTGRLLQAVEYKNSLLMNLASGWYTQASPKPG